MTIILGDVAARVRARGDRWQRAAAALGGEQPWNAQARAQP